MRNSTLALVWTAAIATTAIVAQSRGQQAPPLAVIKPVPFPSSSDFPVADATIHGWIAKSDTSAERSHAWALWAGLNQGSGQSANGNELRVWETWTSISSVVNGDPGGIALQGTAPREIHEFETPRQFRHAAHGIQFDAAANTSIRVLTKFDPEAAAFVSTRQPGPGPAGSTYSYRSSVGLNKLNAAWPVGTAVDKRAINPFPTRAFELKPVMMAVKATGLTIQPLWRGLGGSTNPANPTPDTWTTCVLIDPAGSGDIRAATADEIKRAVPDAGSACKTFLYGPISLFYAFKMTAGEARPFHASAGDYAVLVAMHVNTKEVPLWTWQTFWWQPGADAPGGFPGTKAGQPANLPAPFNNYAACTNYDQTTRPDGKIMDVCFNPYLETSPGIPVGVTSNCISCHGVARVDPKDPRLGPNGQPYPTDYKTLIKLFSDPKYFGKTSTNTDMSWGVADAP
jgi:hypothetical protein